MVVTCDHSYSDCFNGPFQNWAIGNPNFAMLSIPMCSVFKPPLHSENYFSQRSRLKVYLQQGALQIWHSFYVKRSRLASICPVFGSPLYLQRGGLQIWHSFYVIRSRLATIRTPDKSGFRIPTVPATGCIANLTFFPLCRRMLTIWAIGYWPLAWAKPNPGTMMMFFESVIACKKQNKED